MRSFLPGPHQAVQPVPCRDAQRALVTCSALRPACEPGLPEPPGWLLQGPARCRPSLAIC